MNTILSLLQIADSAFPIGSAAHSFGLETVIAEQGLTPDGLEQYIADVLQNGGRQEAWGCLMGWRLAQLDEGLFSAEWQTLNHTISALKTAHELRTCAARSRSDLLVINKIDLAPLVGADLAVMDRDAKMMRDERPFCFTNLKDLTGYDSVLDWVKLSKSSSLAMA